MSFPQTSNRTILIVEDDHNVRRLLGTGLATKGYVPREASDGQEALDYLRRFATPALIILDLEMPGMGGWQYLHRRSYDPKLAAIPVLVVSGIPDGERARSYGRDVEFLAKPVELADLFAAIERLLAPPGERPATARPQPAPRTRTPTLAPPIPRRLLTGPRDR